MLHKITPEYKFPNFISAISQSRILRKISLKTSYEKRIISNFAKIEMTRNLNRVFGRHFKNNTNIFVIFFIEHLE